MSELHVLNQLRFTRSEFRRSFQGVREAEGSQRFMPINSIAWMVGHLAWHEQLYWLVRSGKGALFPELEESNAYGKPPGEPSLMRMIECWERVIEASDDFLTSLNRADLESHLTVNGKQLPFNIGTIITRVTYHYWYHCGEMQAVRQLLGHTNLPDFVGRDIETVGAFYLDD